MMQYQEGQEVEVNDFRPGGWCRAKIIRKGKAQIIGKDKVYDTYRVEFPDGARAMFGTGDIRAISADGECE